MNIKFYLNSKLKEVFAKLGYDTSKAVVNFSSTDIADLQCNASFALAKDLHTSPIVIADNIVSQCGSLCEDFEITNVKGFINFVIKDTMLSMIANKCVKSDRLNVPKLDKPKCMIIDYGGANVAKPLHVGHMRSAIIGEALKRLNRFLGNTVVADVHLGDWGLQMGLTIAQLMDDYDMGYYFGHNVPKVDITIAMLDEAYPKASARKKEDKEFYDRASEITLLLQKKVDGYYQIWQEMERVSVEMVKGTYSRMGATFDLWNGESSVNDIVPYIVDLYKSKGLARESEGALVVDVATEDETSPMPPLLLQKSNGAQMYPVTEIATIFDRVKVYNPDEILYITDNRQMLHFNQVFRAVRMAGIVDDHTVLKHITFGTVNGKDGKPFKTRDGGTFKLEDLIDMVRDKAYEKLVANGVNVADMQDLSEKIGLSALIFGDLSNIIARDYVFDLDKFMTFEGKTGPYLQYTAVRIKSILAKSDIVSHDITIGVDTRDMIVKMLKLIDSFDIAYRDYSLHSIALALYDLCSSFSNFYNNVKILGTENYETRQNYLNTCKLIYNAIELASGILGIKIPEKM